MTHFVLEGIQWSGKWTQAHLLCEKYGFVHFETGGRLRAMAASDHPLAPTIKNIMDTGWLVSMDLIKQVLEIEIAKHLGEMMLFDGVPRTIEQKWPFEEVAGDFVVIFLEVPREEAIRRLAWRRVCPVSGESFPPDFPGDTNPKTGAKLIVRSDDTPEAVAKRIDTYFENTWPLFEMWRREGKTIYEINAVGTPESTFEIVEAIIKKHV